MCTALVVQKFESESKRGRREREGGIVGHGLSMCPLECSTQLDSCNLLWQTCLLSILTMILPPKHTHTHTHKLPPTRTCWSLCVSYIIRAPRAGTHTHTQCREGFERSSRTHNGKQSLHITSVIKCERILLYMEYMAESTQYMAERTTHIAHKQVERAKALQLFSCSALGSWQQKAAGNKNKQKSSAVACRLQ